MLDFNYAAEANPQKSLPRVVFVSGYRRRNLTSYRALNASISACDTADLNSLPVCFDTVSVGKHKILPTFSQMVEKTVRTLNREPAPTVLLGHCGGGAVAFEASKHVDPDMLLGLVLLCPYFVPADNTSLTQKTGLTWLRKNVFASPAYRTANANKSDYLAAAQEVFGRVTPSNLSHLPKEKVVLIGVTRDTISFTEATRRFAATHGYTYYSLEDDHSIRQPQSVAKLKDVLSFLVSGPR